VWFVFGIGQDTSCTFLLAFLAELTRPGGKLTNKIEEVVCFPSTVRSIGLGFNVRQSRFLSGLIDGQTCALAKMQYARSAWLLLGWGHICVGHVTFRAKSVLHIICAMAVLLSKWRRAT